MKSQMLNRRMKQATVLVSRQTLEQAIHEGQALAEKLLQTKPNDPQLDQLEQAVARLSGVFQQGNDNLMDDSKPEGTGAAEIKRDVDMIASMRQTARGGVGAEAEVLPVEGTAGSSGPGWTTDRDENGKPKAPVREEIPRIPLSAAKKKQAEPPVVEEPAPAAGAAAPAPSGNVIDYIPTESLLKIIGDIQKSEDFAQNKGKQDALIELVNVLKARPVVPVEPEPAPAAPVPPNAIASTASAKKAGEPFGGKQAPPFGKKDEKKEDKKDASAKTADDPNAMAGGVQHGPSGKEEFVSEIPQAQGDTRQTKEAAGGESRKDERKDDVPFIGKDATDKTAVAPPGWEGTVKDMKKEKDIDNPFALAWSMKDKGYTPHKASFILRKRGGKYLVEKFAAGSSKENWSNDGIKGNVLEDGGRTPEVAQAHGQVDEAPAKLDRPATENCMKFSSAESTAKFASAVKDAESCGEKLKAMYLDAKPLMAENSTAPVRNFVESIYKAYSLCDDAVKTLNKQEMQEKAEEEAAEIKKQNKKSSLLGLITAGEEE